MNLIPRPFRPPVFDDPEKNHIARILYYYLFGGTILSLVAAPTLFLFRHNLSDVIACALAIFSNLLLFHLLRHGRVRFVAYLAILLSWAINTLFSVTQEGLLSSPLYSYFVLIPVAGFLLGWRAGFFTTILCVASGYVIAIAQNAGLVGSTLTAPFDPIFHWTSATIFLVLAFLIQYLIDTTLRRISSEQQKELAMRRSTEAALRESEARNAAFLHANPDIMFLFSSDGIFLDGQASSEHRLLMPREQFLGRSIEQILPDYLAKATREKILRIRETGQPELYEYQLELEGATRYFETRMVPCGENILAIVRDATDRKRAEEERRRIEQRLLQNERLHAIGTLAGGIAHDFNNILAGILGYADLIVRRAGPDSPFTQPAQNIRAASERAAELVKQILSFSRQTAEEVRPIQLQYTVRESLTLLRELIPPAITITEDTDPFCRSVMIDATHAHQLVTNLVVNAFQAMQVRGTGSIAVALCCRPPTEGGAGGTVILSVADDGPGIAPEHLEKIFDPFFTTKAPGEGTGLGLSIINGLVKRYDGTITVESTVGKGSRFTVELPVATLPFREKPLDRPLFAHLAGTGRLLLVDDEEILVRLGSETLSALGYLVRTETDPLRALKLFRENPDGIDLVITDLMMPGLDGIDLIERMRELRPRLPAILCSGTHNARTAAFAKLGQSTYIGKPMELDRLAGEVKRLIAPAEGTPERSS